jgi:hypothetical protein
MSKSTQLHTSVDQDGTQNVVGLFTEVALDRKAIQAERLALLAELVAEQFSNSDADAAGDGRPAQLSAVRHLERAANLAREAADRERARCAAACTPPCHRRATDDLWQEPA